MILLRLPVSDRSVPAKASAEGDPLSTPQPLCRCKDAVQDPGPNAPVPGQLDVAQANCLDCGERPLRLVRKPPGLEGGVQGPGQQGRPRSSYLVPARRG